MRYKKKYGNRVSFFKFSFFSVYFIPLLKMVAAGDQGNVGYTAQWIVFAIMAVAAIAFAITVVFRPLGRRLPYYVNIAIMMIAATAYYAMAVDKSEPAPGDRKTVYPRYIDWFFTTPLLLLDLILMMNMPAAKIAWIMGADVGMVVLGLIGAFDANDTKWFYFAVSCILMVALLYGMLEATLNVEQWKNPLYITGYATLLVYLIVLWCGYPIVWGLGTGGLVISVDLEIILMGILDVLAKPIFAMGCIILHETVANKLGNVEKLVEDVVETVA
eukprot:TRINITY_DN223_c1_g1_i1.p1 TRINITY_DN223_c1_g1~~TRINITY_DN223_c1_g1_i1.p1  ORF type:complete len:303 (+),score=62.42 TRINITY_DN223_c1_g1_i1:91-909(+)